MGCPAATDGRVEGCTHVWAVWLIVSQESPAEMDEEAIGTEEAVSGSFSVHYATIGVNNPMHGG